MTGEERDALPAPLRRRLSSQERLGCIRRPSQSEALAETPTRVPLIRGYTNIGRDEKQLVNLVADVLQDRGWGHVDRSSITIEDKSGEGWSGTYKVSAPGAIPEAVALHSRSAVVISDPLSEPRMEAAAQFFTKHGCGPCRLAQGGSDWFIEPWEGTGTPRFCSLEKCRELGQFLALIHCLPTDWYDDWRERLRASLPALREVPTGSHVWWYASRPAEFLIPMD